MRRRSFIQIIGIAIAAPVELVKALMPKGRRQAILHDPDTSIDGYSVLWRSTKDDPRSWAFTNTEWEFGADAYKWSPPKPETFEQWRDRILEQEKGFYK